MFKKIDKELSVLVVGKILHVVISLASIKLVTTFLSETEVGNYYLLLSLIALFSFTFLNPIGQYYGRRLVSWRNSGNIKNATYVLLFLRLVGALGAIFLAYIVYKILGYEKYYELTHLLLFIGVALLASTQLVLISAVNLLGFRVRFVVYLLLTLLIGLFLSLFIVMRISNSAIGWLYGQAVSQSLFAIFVLIFLVNKQNLVFCKIKSAFSRDHMLKIAYFIVPITVTLFLQWGQNQSYRFIVETRYSIEILGMIGVGMAVAGSIFNAVEALMVQYYKPIYFKRITEAKVEQRTIAWNSIADQMIPIYLLLLIYVIALAPYLTKILVADKYSGVYVFVMFGAAAEFFRVASNVVYLVSQSEMKTRSTIYPYLMGLILSVAVLLVFNFKDVLWAIPLTLSLSYLCVFIVIYLYMKKLLPISVDVKKSAYSIILGLPLFGILFIDSERSFTFALLIVFVTGVYFLFGCYRIVMKQSDTKIISS